MTNTGPEADPAQIVQSLDDNQKAVGYFVSTAMRHLGFPADVFLAYGPGMLTEQGIDPRTVAVTLIQMGILETGDRSQAIGGGFEVSPKGSYIRTVERFHQPLSELFGQKKDDSEITVWRLPEPQKIVGLILFGAPDEFGLDIMQIKGYSSHVPGNIDDALAGLLGARIVEQGSTPYSGQGKVFNVDARGSRYRLVHMYKNAFEKLLKERSRK